MRTATKANHREALLLEDRQAMQDQIAAAARATRSTTSAGECGGGGGARGGEVAVTVTAELAALHRCNAACLRDARNMRAAAEAEAEVAREQVPTPFDSPYPSGHAPPLPQVLSQVMALNDNVTLYEPQSASSPSLSAIYTTASPPPSMRTCHSPSMGGGVRFTASSEPPTLGASVSVPLSGNLGEWRAQGAAGAPGAPGAQRPAVLRPPHGPARPSSAQPRVAVAAVSGGAAAASGGKAGGTEPQPWVGHLSRPASAGRLRPSSAGRLRASGSVGTLRHRGAVACGASPGVV